MNKLLIYCVTNERVKYLEDTKLVLAGVGKKKFSKNYTTCLRGKNIQNKERNYSELTFHYWFWKNQLQYHHVDDWIGFCQKRRFWLNSKRDNERDDISKRILKSIPNEWENYDAVLCEPIKLGTKLSKLIKRGWKNVIKKPKRF